MSTTGARIAEKAREGSIAKTGDKSSDKPQETTKPACAGLPYLLVFLVFFGSGGRDRTYDQLINSHILGGFPSP